MDINNPARTMEQAKALIILLIAHCQLLRIDQKNRQDDSLTINNEITNWRRYKNGKWWSLIDWNELRNELNYFEEIRGAGRLASLQYELKKIIYEEGDGDIVDTLRKTLVESSDESLAMLNRLQDFMLLWINDPTFDSEETK